MSLEVGQRVRIEGKEFTVANLEQSTLFGKRTTRLQLTLTEDIKPQDAKPSETLPGGELFSYVSDLLAVFTKELNIQAKPGKSS